MRILVNHVLIITLINHVYIQSLLLPNISLNNESVNYKNTYFTAQVIHAFLSANYIYFQVDWDYIKEDI